MSEEEDEGYIIFGKPLKEFAEGETIRKRPISVEEQIVTDRNGKRRFHGAFTGGFSAGFFNTVDTPQGFVPSHFKSSRRGKDAEEDKEDGKDRRHVAQQKPEDFMDDEDFGSFGFASQALKTKSRFQTTKAGQAEKARVPEAEHSLLGPAITQLIQPTRPTIGESLLRAQGWKPGQGIGPKMSKRTKKARKESHVRSYGSKNERGNSSDEDENFDKYQDFMFAPDELPLYVAAPKENFFGIGYKGLDRPTLAGASSAAFRVKSGIHKKKFSISGEAFGVGAYEEDDDDIYNNKHNDMAQYDFALDVTPSGASKAHTSNQSRTLENRGSVMDQLTDVLDGFTLSTKRSLLTKSFVPPRIPREWKPPTSGYKKKSRFDDARPEVDTKKPTGSNPTREQRRSTLFPGHSSAGTSSKREEESKPVIKKEEDVKEEAEEMPDFLLNNEKPPSSSLGDFKPFKSDPDKQVRYEQFLVCIKNNRRDALRLLQPKRMTEWERERERVEFERAAHLYKPLNTAIASRFVSSGTIREDGSLEDSSNGAAQASAAIAFLPGSGEAGAGHNHQSSKAAQMKMFGQMTRNTEEWVPARILCVRFNVKNPFNNTREPDNQKKKPIFESNQLFAYLGSDSRTSDRREDAGNISRSSNNDNEQAMGTGSAQKDNREDKTSDSVMLKQEPVNVSRIVLVKDEPDVKAERPPMDLFKAIFADDDSDVDSNDEGNIDNSNDDDSVADTMKRKHRDHVEESSSASSSRHDSPAAARINDDPARGIFAGINFDKFVKRRRKTPPPVIPLKALTSRPKSILDRSVRNILGIKSGDISDDEYGPVAPPALAAAAPQKRSDGGPDDKRIVISSESDDSSEGWEEKDKSKKSKKKKSKHKKEKRSKKKKKKNKHKSSRSDSD
eukprot:TRINITY_DN4789_c0_g1_i1.p1 TRINITY_DN4789_c0_g1~~TRINITY_DN4789_c0_g1_i1.p1  ORF type:complete len:897 (-),score=275.21 TRINITY_DN4789_c0_g1_i1:324-3014(-)